VPIFVALHHPLDSGEFAPGEYATLIDLLRDYNVALVLYGHGHNVVHKTCDGIDAVMGGSTFGKRAGYGLVCVQDGMLCVAYRYHKPQNKAEAWRVLFEKPLARSVPERLFAIERPAVTGDAAVVEDRFTMSLSSRAALDDVRVNIGGEAMKVVPGEAGTWRVSGAELAPGYHLMTVRARTADGRADLRTRVVRTGDSCVKWRVTFPAAMKAGPVIVGDTLCVAQTDGTVAGLSRGTGRVAWTAHAEAEILGTPAWTGKTLVFGAGDGKVYALDDAGRTLWTQSLDGPAYGWPLVDGDRVYVGDNAGFMHALALDDGRAQWKAARADYSIEAQPCVWGQRVTYGAWDGYLYAVARETGEQAFRVLGPKSSEGAAARYYAPADCGPVAVGEKLFVCDRGYVLGVYDRQGKLEAKLADDIAAIAPGPDGSVIARSKENRVCRFASDGSLVWERAVPAGRFPIPPTVHGDAVYVCSNGGLLSVLDVETGAVRWKYQVTPGLYVMAPVAVDADGTCYVAGMDGTVTALRGR
jgi:outer membrane protein assembly factor BamB